MLYLVFAGQNKRYNIRDFLTHFFLQELLLCNYLYDYFFPLLQLFIYRFQRWNISFFVHTHSGMKWHVHLANPGVSFTTWPDHPLVGNLGYLGENCFLWFYEISWNECLRFYTMYCFHFVVWYMFYWSYKLLRFAWSLWHQSTYK